MKNTRLLLMMSVVVLSSFVVMVQGAAEGSEWDTTIKRWSALETAIEAGDIEKTCDIINSGAITKNDTAPDSDEIFFRGMTAEQIAESCLAKDMPGEVVAGRVIPPTREQEREYKKRLKQIVQEIRFSEIYNEVNL
jgi:hypothetical protein